MDCISNDIDPKVFFERYIAERKPVLIEGHLVDKEWKASMWTNDYLISKAGDRIVNVERKRVVGKEFGNGVEEKIDFRTLIEQIGKNDSSYYLTTQELDYTMEGRPSLISPPVDGLVGDFPWRPSIMGNLVLQNANIWIGCGGADQAESTSGLHHDYHDNLYIVLRGKKRLVLISPEFTKQLYTVGEVETVHPNGRINYVGQSTRADGSSLNSDKAISASQRILDASLKLTDNADDSGEDELEAALEDALDAEIEDDYVDDENEDEDAELDNDTDCSDSPDGSESGCALEDNTLTKKRAAAEDCNDEQLLKQQKTDYSTDKPDPPNFSRLKTTRLPMDETLRLERERELIEKFPLFVDIARKHTIEVTVNAGQMLYLPAGWFHEVFSSGQIGLEDRSHIAFNYWFHPPDSSTFDKPYSSSFWMDDWLTRINDNEIV